MKRMWRVALAVLCCAVSIPLSTWGAVSFVKGTSTIQTTSQNPTNNLGTVTAGHCIVGYISWHSNTITLDSITDNSNTYTLYHNPTTTLAGAARAAVFVAENINGGSTTLTFNFSASVQSHSMVHEVSGCATSGAKDQSALQAQSVPGTGTDAVTSGSVTTTTNGQYIFGAGSNPLNGNAYTVGTNYTERLDPATPNDWVKTEDLIQTSAGSIAATFTTADGGGQHLTGIVTLKEAATGAVNYFMRRVQ